jgi:methionine-rich copper-binding protein CopC
MFPVLPYRRWLGCLAVAAVLLLSAPAVVSAHSELTSAVPAEGTTVPSPFTGPILLTFSAHLAAGSKADLVGPDGLTLSSATVDADAKTMTVAPSTPLAPSAYRVEWTSIADDGDLLRGIVTFTVATSTASPTPSASIAASRSASTAPPRSAVPSPAAATPAPSGSGTTGGAGSDVILPIVIAVIVIAAGAFYLLRRNRPA